MPTRAVAAAQAKTIPLTSAAFAQKQTKFEQLTAERELVVERLKVAREMGDLSENGAYHAAKFELGSIGRQLRELKHLLDHSYVAELPSTSSQVSFGHNVTLRNGNKSLTFMLVSDQESDPKQQKLSLQSPIGQAVLGKKLGDVIEVLTPGGKITYTIEKITSAL
jgi:transcription elongation factor GreA